LAGFPPFPGFWAKWELIRQLAPSGALVWVVLILLGSLLEVAYLFRWFGYAARGEKGPEGEKKTGLERYFVMILFAALLTASGYLFGGRALGRPALMMWPLAASAGLILFENFHPRIRASVAIATLGYFGWMIVPMLSGIPFFFALLFLSGGILVLIASLYRNTGSKGFYPLMTALTGSLAVLAVSKTPIQFFFLWEVMTVSSYFLLLRGRKAGGPSLAYMIFSAASAYLVMAGFSIGGETVFGVGHILPAVAAGPVSAAVFVLFALGFLIKVAGIGVHTWAPGAYSEAEDDMSAMMSGVLSKAGVLGFIFLFSRAGSSFRGAEWFYYALGWAGAATAFFGALYASMQEDAKKLLAWSSLGQVGYIILAASAMSHLGWVSAFYHSVNHLMFKLLLFLAIAGVVFRTGTREMYEMGGLIKRMPLSFISVMIGIIALSGVPPLTGFGGKWLLYNALVEKGWYLQASLGFFSSTVAFLYCFRLIHSIFLGQAKPAFKEVREAPMALIIPQYILIMAIMAVSTFPGLLIKPISAIVGETFTSTLSWDGGTLRSSMGYWNGTVVMLAVGFIFAIVLVILLIKSPRPQKVGQFNIVFASERPDRPETTHYAWRFFSPYQRAFSGLLVPRAERFWRAAGE
ncbi:MAG TPA: proton-conducting transporter membrane subunit, partial [Candidatus Krumholzibacterium sp.]|nr:proton-conducting transporter membrane subunit [Candidatus Krumholzibacterium sp.]